MSEYEEYKKLKDLDDEFDLTEEFQNITKQEKPSDMQKFLEIDVLSDTHTKHEEIDTSLLNGDILIFAGDFMRKSGSKVIDAVKTLQIKRFNEWIGKLEHKLKLVVCGNHDEIDELPEHEIRSYLSNCVYLQNNFYDLEVLNFFPSKKVDDERKTIKIYGSPATYYRPNYWKPFMERDMKKNWDRVPLETNILVTHLPSFTILDLAACKPFNWSRDECKDCGKAHFGFRHTGCKILREKVEELKVKGKLETFIFGHAHDRYGAYISKKNGLLYVNPSVTNRHFNVVKKPMKIYYSLSE